MGLSKHAKQSKRQTVDKWKWRERKSPVRRGVLGVIGKREHKPSWERQVTLVRFPCRPMLFGDFFLWHYFFQRPTSPWKRHGIFIFLVESDSAWWDGLESRVKHVWAKALLTDIMEWKGGLEKLVKERQSIWLANKYGYVSHYCKKSKDRKVDRYHGPHVGTCGTVCHVTGRVRQDF